MHCLGSHFLISDLNISTSFRSLSSGTIFHTLDAKKCKESKPKWVVLTILTEKLIWDLKWSIESSESSETMRKLCLSTKFPHQEIRWSYGIFRSEQLLGTKKILYCKETISYKNLDASCTIWIWGYKGIDGRML